MHDGTYEEEGEKEYQDVTYQSSRSHSLMLGMKEFSKACCLFRYIYILAKCLSSITDNAL